MTTKAITPLRQRMIEDMNARKLGAARASRLASVALRTASGSRRRSSPSA